MVKWKLNAKEDYPEECHGTSTIEGTISDVRLAGEILSIFNGRYHPLHRKERRQVGGVRGYDDQREEPPYTAHDSRARCLIKFINVITLVALLSIFQFIVESNKSLCARGRVSVITNNTTPNVEQKWNFIVHFYGTFTAERIHKLHMTLLQTILSPTSDSLI